MTLDNLIGKSLEAITPDAVAIKRLTDAAERNIADANIAGLSNENKFDMAYKAIMQLANLAMQANVFVCVAVLLKKTCNVECTVS